MELKKEQDSQKGYPVIQQHEKQYTKNKKYSEDTIETNQDIIKQQNEKVQSLEFQLQKHKNDF